MVEASLQGANFPGTVPEAKHNPHTHESSRQTPYIRTYMYIYLSLTHHLVSTHSSLAHIKLSLLFTHRASAHYCLTHCPAATRPPNHSHAQYTHGYLVPSHECGVKGHASSTLFPAFTLHACALPSVLLRTRNKFLPKLIFQFIIILKAVEAAR